MEFNAKEIKTVKDLIEDWGFEYNLQAKRNEVIELAKKIGMKKEYITEHLEID